jgi:hypothetical protein
MLKLLYQVCMKYVEINYFINFYINFDIKYNKNIIDY